MNPDGFARMQAIFEAAIDLPPSERKAYLSEACGEDVELRATVERLIEADDETETIGGPFDQRPAPIVRECSRCSRCYDDPIATCPVDGTALDVAFPGPLLIDGKYLIERCLGRGGMGAVYLVKHTLLGKHFALKVISTDGPIPQSYLKNFENEAFALGRLKHPNIVDVTDYGVDPRRGGLPYLVMEYLEGRTIRQALQEHTWLPFPDAADHLRPVAAAIDFAHAHNIVHGDLKPANLFLAKQADGSEIVKVVDFGLAQLRSGEAEDRTASMESSARSTGSGSVRGTPAYMAPELFRGEDASPQSDQFAFGVLTYEMLTGLQPFGKRVFDVTERHSGSVPRPSTLEPALPAELDSPILNLLDRAPEMRPPSASAAVSTMEDAWLRAEQRKWRERELPQRYVFALVAASIAIAIAAWLASWRVVRILESRTVDSRFALAAKRLPDPRLLVVMLDDSAMAEEPRSLAQWDGKFADLVERILGGGARAVALDFLLPASWSTSRSFARLVEQHSDRIQLAIFSELGKVVGTECIGTLTARLIGPERYSALFGFANLEEDQDGRIRRARAAYSDPEGTIIGQSLAARAIIAASLSPAGFNPVNRAVWIDYSVSPRDIPSVSWSDAGARSPDFFNDKLVMIGADFAGSTDRHRVPEPADPDWVPGVLVHAMIANTIVRGFPVRDAGLPACLAFMSLACFGTVALAIRFPHRPWLAIIAAAASFSGYALFAFGIFRLSRTMLVMVAPETALLLSMVIAWRLRARLAPYPMKGA